MFLMMFKYIFYHHQLKLNSGHIHMSWSSKNTNIMTCYGASFIPSECKLQPVGHGQDAQVPAAALPPADCSPLPTRAGSRHRHSRHVPRAHFHKGAQKEGMKKKKKCKEKKNKNPVQHSSKCVHIQHIYIFSIKSQIKKKVCVRRRSLQR